MDTIQYMKGNKIVDEFESIAKFNAVNCVDLPMFLIENYPNFSVHGFRPVRRNVEKNNYVLESINHGRRQQFLLTSTGISVKTLSN